MTLLLLLLYSDDDDDLIDITIHSINLTYADPGFSPNYKFGMMLIELGIF